MGGGKPANRKMEAVELRIYRILLGAIAYNGHCFSSTTSIYVWVGGYYSFFIITS